MADAKRSGTVIRTDLSQTEWRKIRKLARQERLTGSQYVGRILRETLATKDAA